MKTISRCARGVKQPYGASFSTEQRAGNGLFKGNASTAAFFLKAKSPCEGSKSLPLLWNALTLSKLTPY